MPDRVMARGTGSPPHAGSFIVTVYGDVVEPRGGTLWMGTLIDVCADHGISEGLVRTAVSRLVASGRLVGERQGRKSYYRLTTEGRSEFAAAARILFGRPPTGQGWLIRFHAADAPEVSRSVGWAAGVGYSIAPDREDVARPDGLVFSATTPAASGALVEFASRHWDLAPISAAYRNFIDVFRGVADDTAKGACPEGAASLALRLRVVHEYRRVLLSDPRLPEAALPRDWPGEEARRLFVSLYLALTDSADRHVGQTFRDSDGLLPAETAGTWERVESLGNETSA